jgi:hypothetical protein
MKRFSAPSITLSTLLIAQPLGAVNAKKKAPDDAGAF